MQKYQTAYSQTVIGFPTPACFYKQRSIESLLINDQLVGEVYSLFDGSKVESIYPQFHQYSSRLTNTLLLMNPNQKASNMNLN